MANLPLFREFQARALDNLRAAFREGCNRVMLYGPTGSGKTVMGEGVVAGAVNRGNHAAFVCNRVELVRQASRRFLEDGIWHGIIQGANTRDVDEQVLVGSIQTIARRGFPEKQGIILIDEAHACAGSVAYRNFIFQHQHVPIIGLSATPFSRGLGKHYDELNGPLFERLIVSATIRELIDAGFLVDVDVYAPEIPDLSGVRTVAGDYDEAQLGHVMDQPKMVGDIIEHWQRLGDNRPTVVFAVNIAHSKHIVGAFREAGVSAEHIDCYTSDIERAAILERVRRGETRVISNVSILAEGWDFPACAVMVLARPTKSLIRYIQMAGRILRIYPGKDRATLIDHSGSALNLGLPTDDLPLELDDGKPRKPGKTRDADEPKPRQCPSCKAVIPAKAKCCPICNWKPDPVQEIVMKKGALKLLRHTAAPTKADKQSLYSQFVHVAIERKKKLGWADHLFKDLTGHFPRGLDPIPEEPSEDIRKFVLSKLIRFSKGRGRANQRAA